MAQPEVEIEQGVLQGSIAADFEGGKFFKFQGIPFAKPPLNELRFKAPQPPEKWTGILDATKHGDVCYHQDPITKVISGSENCLFLNVYTKQLPGNDAQKLRPVMVWIHGGGFYFGSGNEVLYGPDFLITQDVVVVTFNYRLGMLGFASFEDPTLEIPGNAGLKDQVMALKWVQKNISHFGGDPNNVTIFGESAGGASVHLLVLSPMAKGLFHKAIAQSGCAVNPWVRGSKTQSLLAKSLELEDADEKTLCKILMQKSTEELFEIQNKMNQLPSFNEPRPLSFVIESKSPTAFLDTEPSEIMSSGTFNHVPFMVGYTTGEGMIFELLRKGKVDFKELVPWNFGYQNNEEIQTIADKIKKRYLSDEKDSQRIYSETINAMSDSQFIYGIQATALSHLKTSKTPIYLYRMSIETELNFLKKFLQITIPGVSHLDDVGYLFKHFATPEIKHESIEDISLRRFIRLWTNFAKFANPTPEKNDSLLKSVWKPLNTNLDFLDIGKDLVPLSNPDAERMDFWKKLFAESPAGQKLV